MCTKDKVTTLNIQEVKNMFIYVGEKIIDKKPLLTQIDSDIGDGDHGVGMEIGLKKATESLHDVPLKSINEVFNIIGKSMISSMGGASGIIFGTFFLGGVKNFELKEKLNLIDLATIFSASLEAIKKRGKASLGDKTMVDALEPAVEILNHEAKQTKNLVQGLEAAEKEARNGVENTKKYVAKFGRAKSLGERALGYQDAGATTIWIIFKSMKEWIEAMEKNE